MQLAFLPEYQPVPIYMEGIRLSLVNLQDLLQSDLNNKILQLGQFNVIKGDRDTFKRVSLFHYP